MRSARLVDDEQDHRDDADHEPRHYVNGDDAQQGGEADPEFERPLDRQRRTSATFQRCETAWMISAASTTFGRLLNSDVSTSMASTRADERRDSDRAPAPPPTVSDTCLHSATGIPRRRPIGPAMRGTQGAAASGRACPTLPYADAGSSLVGGACAFAQIQACVDWPRREGSYVKLLLGGRVARGHRSPSRIPLRGSLRSALSGSP